MPAFWIALVAFILLLAYEAVQIVRGQPTITEQARSFQQRQPGLVSLLMLALGVVLGHLWWH